MHVKKMLYWSTKTVPPSSDALISSKGHHKVFKSPEVIQRIIEYLQ